jgi:hypothetical protein
MYLENIKLEFLRRKLAYSTANIFPCSNQEISELEKKVGLRLPVAYKEFLMWGGNGVGSFMQGSRFRYEDLIGTQEIAKEMLEEDSSPDRLPADAFVFWMHGGYMFSFFRISEGDNPPVHHYCEGQNNGKVIWNKQRSFTRFLEVEIEDQANALDNAASIQERIARDWTRG